MNDKFRELRKLYPEDIEQIERDEKRIQELLEDQEFYRLPVTQRLVAQCREEVVRSRLKLASDKSLAEAARGELWAIIDARQWFLKIVAQDYEAELQTLDEELTAQIEKAQ